MRHGSKVVHTFIPSVIIRMHAGIDEWLNDKIQSFSAISSRVTMRFYFTKICTASMAGTTDLQVQDSCSRCLISARDFCNCHSYGLRNTAQPPYVALIFLWHSLRYCYHWTHQKIEICCFTISIIALKTYLIKWERSANH